MIVTCEYKDLHYDRVWLTSDTHFGHENIIRYCGRPWPNADRMDRALLNNINSAVNYNDLLIIVGDLTLAGPTRSRYAERIVRQLPPNKILVYGNHDRFKPSWYLKRGFEIAATSLVLSGGVLVVHKPADSVHVPTSKPVVCGHVHDLYKSFENIVNVGVDMHDYKPILLEDALAMCELY